MRWNVSGYPKPFNNGYAGEALHALISWGQHNARIRKVMARTHQNNLASQQLLLKAGFVKMKAEEEILIYIKEIV